MKKTYIADRIASMPTSIFSSMSKMAFEYKAVNLGQGFPDFDGPSWIMDEAYKAMKAGKNQYAPTAGIFSLRRQIAEYHKKFYDIEWSPETNITITAGATEALFSVIHAFINKGDEVIIFEPFYDGYYADVILAGGIPKPVTLYKPEFNFNINELEDAVNKSTKMIILNTPHNPTGKIFSKEEMQAIADIAIKYDLLVLSDEVYEFLLFENAKHIPIASLEGMRERTITVSSTGKTFGLTGWKIGYVIANTKLTEAVQKVHQWTTFAVNTPGQHAMAFAFAEINEYLPDFIKTYTRKRDLVLDILKDSKFKPYKPQGSYFIMTDIPMDIFKDDVDCAMKLVKDYGVAVIPPSVFYLKSDEGKTMLRLCFAKSDETLIDGANRLKNI